MNMTYGVIGEHLPHSFSKIIHEKIETYSYTVKELAPSELDAFFKEKNFKGINVTIPYKEAVIPYLDELDEAAKQIGAVNTVVNENGRLIGYNTDFKGLAALVSHAKLSLAEKKVLILGTGGTSKTAKALAIASGARAVYRVSYRQCEDAILYADAYRDHADAEILINTTPCGMFPKLDSLPCDAFGNELDLSRFTKLEGVIDVIYNPIRTRLTQNATARGIVAVNGLYMLVAQAVYAAEYFQKKTYPDHLIEEIYQSVAAEKENIVLIGMPSSGKTTVGRLIAEKTNRRFVDTDEEIVKAVGKDIPTIFKEEGEKAFRRYESAVIERLSGENSLVIATGGGAILSSENRTRLRYNGKLCFLDRSLPLLTPTSDRPTASDKNAIEKRFAERYPLYCQAADEIIAADGTPDTVAAAIVSHYIKKD